MKKHIILLLAYLSCCYVHAQESPSIIPSPSNYAKGDGSFLLTEKTVIQFSDKAIQDEANYLQTELLRKLQFPLVSTPLEDNSLYSIKLSLSAKEKSDYSLQINSKEINVVSATEEGIFHGITSLIQLIEQAEKKGPAYELSSWTISDAPLYQWRGFMLDESRHFFGEEKVKELLDWMAYYKLNKFHWHLTDAPGWRIEIKKYPKLTLVGGIGNHTDPLAPAQYYTQEQIKEIVRYAAERKIEVIPEIDMPGHATAANKAYPEYSGGGSQKYPDFVFHPGKTATYQYLTDILKEVNALFPSQMIHLGGDEVSFGNQMWNTDPLVQQLMKNEGLDNLKEVEEYFMKRMADSLFNLNNKLLAWDEMADAGLPNDKSILFWWRHDQKGQFHKLLENNIPTVICPRIPFYFDFVQQDSDQYGRKWAGEYNTLETVYTFAEGNYNVPESKKHLILGVQGALWTETVTDEDRLDYLTFPRMAALSESAWTAPEQKDFEGFTQRLEGHLKLYKKAALYFFDPFDPKKHPEPIIRN
ncbi:beta-N-acetylhexosaminidase [Echinicola sediminis]